MSYHILTYLAFLSVCVDDGPFELVLQPVVVKFWKQVILEPSTAFSPCIGGDGYH